MKADEKIIIMEEMIELGNCENKIKTEIQRNENLNEISFEKYALINKDWIENYKKYYNYSYFLKYREVNPQPSSSDNIFIIDYLFPEYYEKTFKEDNGKATIIKGIPKNFVLVSKNFLQSILKKFNIEKNNQIDLSKKIFMQLIYEVKIGGSCIFIKNKLEEFSYFISSYKAAHPDIKYNYYYNTDFIDYILIIKI